MDRRSLKTSSSISKRNAKTIDHVISAFTRNSILWIMLSQRSLGIQFYGLTAGKRYLFQNQCAHLCRTPLKRSELQLVWPASKGCSSAPCLLKPERWLNDVPASYCDTAKSDVINDRSEILFSVELMNKNIILSVHGNTQI